MDFVFVPALPVDARFAFVVRFAFGDLDGVAVSDLGDFLLLLRTPLPPLALLLALPEDLLAERVEDRLRLLPALETLLVGLACGSEEEQARVACGDSVGSRSITSQTGSES